MGLHPPHLVDEIQEYPWTCSKQRNSAVKVHIHLFLPCSALVWFPREEASDAVPPPPPPPPQLSLSAALWEWVFCRQSSWESNNRLTTRRTDAELLEGYGCFWTVWSGQRCSPAKQTDHLKHFFFFLESSSAALMTMHQKPSRAAAGWKALRKSPWKPIVFVLLTLNLFWLQNLIRTGKHSALMCVVTTQWSHRCLMLMSLEVDFPSHWGPERFHNRTTASCNH